MIISMIQEFDSMNSSFLKVDFQKNGSVTFVSENIQLIFAVLFAAT